MLQDESDYNNEYDGSGIDEVESIDPRDSYSDRFSVTSRKSVARYKAKSSPSSSGLSRNRDRNYSGRFSKKDHGAKADWKYTAPNPSRRTQKRYSVSLDTEVLNPTYTSSTFKASQNTKNNEESSNVNASKKSEIDAASDMASSKSSTAFSQSKGFSPSKKSDVRVDVTNEDSNNLVNSSDTKYADSGSSKSGQASNKSSEGSEAVRSSGLDALFSSTASNEPISNQAKKDKKNNTAKVQSSGISMPQGNTVNRANYATGSENLSINSPKAAPMGGPVSIFADTNNQSVESSAASTSRISNNMHHKPNSDIGNKNVSRKAEQSREVKIIAPTDYNCVENISIALNKNNVLVLVFGDTAPSLTKRVLDFTFGAASMCGAQIELGADKTYIVTIDYPLTQSEKLLLFNKGIILKNKDF